MPFSVNLPLIAIIGPTASGKSKLALKLAKRLRGAVISADSQQIYQHAAIGTNQPEGKWQKATSQQQAALGLKKIFEVQGVPHFFIGTLSPNAPYSAARFQTEVSQLCLKLYAIGYVPILAGGTGLYVSAVVQGYQFPKGKPNRGLRLSLERLSTSELLRRLRKLDKPTYRLIDHCNRRRVIRALEYVRTTGQSFLTSQARTQRPNTLMLGLAPIKTTLRRNIEQRTRVMFRHGLVAETKQLMRRYPRSPLLGSIGYREAVDLLTGKTSRAEAQRSVAAHTWQYARRQLTWFKRLPNVHWVTNYRRADKLTRKFLTTNYR